MPRTTARKDCNENVELPLYESFEEDPSLDCVLCKQHSDDPIEFGKKLTLNDVTVHHFCLLLSSNLRPIENLDGETEHILGYTLSDIKKEVKRASKLVCAYCKENGASIGCWIRKCKKSFHLPCAKENDCAMEFTDVYRSYCNVHYATNTLNTDQKHDNDELCSICELSMDEYNPMKSLQMICCTSDSWYHKACLKELAFSMKIDDFSCPNCQDKDEFQENMLANGIFIPEKNYLPKPAEEIQPAKRRRVHKDWVFEKTFHSKADAAAAIENEKCWSYYYKNSSSTGVRINYRCNLMKFRGDQCAAGLYLLFDACNPTVHLYRADTVHTHDDECNKENAVNKIVGEIEAEIRNMFESNQKPKAILYNLVRKGLTPPTKATLNNFLAKLRKEKFGSARLNYGTLQIWLSENTSEPSSDDEPFIVNYEMTIDDKSPENSKFRFLVSTKLLLKNAVNVEKVHTDATYKIVWQGFPILLIGTTDSNRKFHPFGVCVSTNERSGDFEFMFQSLKEKVKTLFEVEIDPKVLICDAADSIHNGWSKVFPLRSKDIIMCWAHVRRAVSKNLSKYLKEEKRRNEFLYDLDKLQLARSEIIFGAASKLFIQKWTRVSKDLVNYFENEWLKQHGTWYEGFRPKTPSSNNALESKNKGIKDEHTLRERLDLGQFRVVLYAMIKQWSIEYSSGLNILNFGAPNIELVQWTNGYNFARSNVKVTSKRSGRQVVYTIPVGSSTNDDSSNVSLWRKFDDYRHKAFEFVHTSFEYPITCDNFLFGECDCANGFKLFICEHIIGIALRLKITEAPAAAKTIPIGQKRKRGRPAKAKPALETQ